MFDTQVNWVFYNFAIERWIISIVNVQLLHAPIAGMPIKHEAACFSRCPDVWTVILAFLFVLSIVFLASGTYLVYHWYKTVSGMANNSTLIYIE